MSDKERKLNRRVFLQHTAAVSATTAGLYGIALKTDALAEVAQNVPNKLLTDGPSPYPYQDTSG